MFTATAIARSLQRVTRGGTSRPAAVALLLVALLAPAARADEVVEGLFVTVGNPITSDVTNRVKEITTRAVQRFKSAPETPGAAKRILKIIYDFNPDNRPAGTRDFGPCHDLATFLLEQQHDVHTIAFVHQETTRHTLLPVLACRDIVLSSGARLGDVRRDQDLARPLPATVLAAYREVIKDRRCPAVVLKMLDPDMEVLRAKKLTSPGEWYIDRRERDAEAKSVVVLDPNPVLGAGAGTTLYTTEQAEKFGLCVLRKESRQEVAQAYGLPPTSLREDPLMGRNPVAWRIDVRGAVTDALAATVKRQVGRAVSQGANLIVLQLECGGGDTLAARDLAEYLRHRKDDRGEYPIMTVAYVPKNAPDTAAFLALGCTEIVLHKDALLGDFSALVSERRNGAVVPVDPARYRAKRESLEGLAQAQGYPVLLARGMMDPTLTIYQVRDRKTGGWAFVTGEELQADRAAGAGAKWGNEQLVKEGGPNGRPLVLTADEARRWGLIRHRVEGLNELYALHGLNPAQVQVAGPDWQDDEAEFLRQPLTRLFLIIIGVTCLLLELKMPGVGVPGVLAAVCFILFFWSHSQSAGLDLLAILLFVLGLVLLAMEVFVLPGFGVAGISGVLLVVFSLALVALEKRPQTSDEWMGLLKLMGQFGVGLVAAVIIAMTFAHYLPNIPYLNRLVLKPLAEGPEGVVEASPITRPEVAALLGAIGVAATPLRPAGKVQFGDDYVDVVAEGSYVTPGTRVQVVEIEGNRIVVKEVL